MTDEKFDMLKNLNNLVENGAKISSISHCNDGSQETFNFTIQKEEPKKLLVLKKDEKLIKRLQDEKESLEEKIKKLDSFLNSHTLGHSAKTPEINYSYVLVDQLDAMDYYLDCLEKRINLLKSLDD